MKSHYWYNLLRKFHLNKKYQQKSTQYQHRYLDGYVNSSRQFLPQSSIPLPTNHDAYSISSRSNNLKFAPSHFGINRECLFRVKMAKNDTGFPYSPSLGMIHLQSGILPFFFQRTESSDSRRVIVPRRRNSELDLTEFFTRKRACQAVLLQGVRV